MKQTFPLWSCYMASTFFFPFSLFPSFYFSLHPFFISPCFSPLTWNSCEDAKPRAVNPVHHLGYLMAWSRKRQQISFFYQISVMRRKNRNEAAVLLIKQMRGYAFDFFQDAFVEDETLTERVWNCKAVKQAWEDKFCVVSSGRKMLKRLWKQNWTRNNR